VRERLLAAPPSTCRHGLGEVTSAEIDALGLGEARRLVFERALDDYATRHPDAAPTRLIVDGTLFRPWRGVPHACVPRADATYPCVMAASVLAKTTRDRQIEALCDADPTLETRYALRRNKGYLSAAHVAGLRAHGRSALHRHSYHIRALDGHQTTLPAT
jgi:ribonuclease HII